MENENLPTKYIRQPYPITMARHRLNIHEMRIMLRITEVLQEYMEYGKELENVQTNLLGDKIIFIPTKNLLTDGSKHYEDVRKALKNLVNQPICIKGFDKKRGHYEINTRLILRSEYNSNNQTIKLLIGEELLPSYLALAQNYSRYLLEVAFNSSSTYTMRLYQFISHHKDKGSIPVSIEELRDWLQIGDKYQHSKDLRQFILEPVAKELKERADVWFEISDPMKEGKRIVGWNLKISKKQTEEAQDPASEGEKLIRHLRSYFKMTESQIYALQPIITRPELYKRLFTKIADVAKQLQVQKGNIKSPAMYFIASAKEEFKEFYGVKVEAQVKRNRQRGFKK